MALVAMVTAPLAGQAAADSSALRDSAGVASARADTAFGLGTREGSEASLPLFLRAYELYRRAGAVAQAGEMLGNVAYIHNSLGRPDSALAYYRQLIAFLHQSSQLKGLSEAFTLVGEVFHGQGQMDSALAYYHEALVLVRTTPDGETEGRALSNLGVAFQSLGHPDSALGYLNRALVIRQELGDSLGEAVTLNNLATVQQTLGRPDSAIGFLRRSLILRRAVQDRAGEGTTLNNIGYSFEQLSQRDSALSYYRAALPILREVGRRSTMGITLANMGRVWLELGALDSALVYLNAGLVVKRDVGDKAGQTWALNDLGRVYQALGRPDTAIALLNQALALLREVGDRAREGEALYNLAQVYHRSRGDLRVAVAYYDSAAVVRTAVQGYAGGDANRLSFAEQDVRLYENWALAWLGRSGEIGVQPAALAALAAAERGRAQALLDLIRATPAAGSIERPAAVAPAEGARLAGQAGRSGAATLYYLVTPETLLVWLIAPSGEVTVAREALSRDSLAALVAALRGGLGVDDLSVADVAFRAVAALEQPGTRPTARRGLRFAEPAAQALAALVLPPELAAKVDSAIELVIIPQGELALVPFASLPLGRPETALARPFGTSHPIRYAPSLSSWSEAEARSGLHSGARRATELRGSLVVGNPQMPTPLALSGAPVTLASLPEAEAEARWVANRLKASVLTGAAASETQVRHRLHDAPLIHLATHGYAFSTEAHARQSFVALAPGAGQDGLLTVGEMLDDSTLALRAELVVLSACQTGLGDLKQAEGTVGLQRAFLARGARSVLVSLWSVSDVVTDQLMRRFYTHWLEDLDTPSKAQALRRAQEDVRATPGYAHPRFWAAFQLVGAR